jgi:hypothetical protein
MLGCFAPSRHIGRRWMMFMDSGRSVLWAQLQSVGVTTMSSATTSVATVSAHTEQPAPGAESRSQNTQIPDELWSVLILSLILLVLLAWRAIEEAGDASGTNSDSSTWFPPY